MSYLRNVVLSAILLGAGLGCGDRLEPAAIDGTYALISVDGCPVGTPLAPCPLARGPMALDGEMVLRPDGSVTRSVRYERGDGAGVQAVVATGTYSLQRGSVELALREVGVSQASVWRLHAVSEGARLTVRYPHPADGEVVESFRRE
jgi:hypothetical protein